MLVLSAAMAASQSSFHTAFVTSFLVFMLVSILGVIGVSLGIGMRANRHRALTSQMLGGSATYLAGLMKDKRNRPIEHETITDFARRYATYNAYAKLGFGIGGVVSVAPIFALNLGVALGWVPAALVDFYLSIATWLTLSILGSSVAIRLFQARFPLLDAGAPERPVREDEGRARFLRGDSLFLLIYSCQVIGAFLATAISAVFIAASGRYSTVGQVNLQGHLWLVWILPVYMLLIVGVIELIVRPSLLQSDWVQANRTPLRMIINRRQRAQQLRWMRRSVTIVVGLILVGQVYFLSDTDSIFTAIALGIAGIALLGGGLVNMIARIRSGPVALPTGFV